MAFRKKLRKCFLHHGYLETRDRCEQVMLGLKASPSALTRWNKQEPAKRNAPRKNPWGRLGSSPDQPAPLSRASAEADYVDEQGWTGPEVEQEAAPALRKLVRLLLVCVFTEPFFHAMCDWACLLGRVCAERLVGYGGFSSCAVRVGEAERYEVTAVNATELIIGARLGRGRLAV